MKYEAITRGSFIEVTSNLDSLTYKTAKDLKEIKLGKKLIKEVKVLLDKINYSELKNLKPPSTKSYTDAALQATLSIQIETTIYKTPTFDHGNPPKEIKELVNKLLEIVK